MRGYFIVCTENLHQIIYSFNYYHFIYILISYLDYLDLAVLQAFPCRSGLGDKDSAARVEDEVSFFFYSNLEFFINL